MDTRHQVRLQQEWAEKTRRQKVITGEWTEAESRGKLANYLADLRDQYESAPSRRQQKREIDRFMQKMKLNQSQNNMVEKEYHFDEGVGVSLNEHVENLKKQFPTARVQTRRDRDGFAVVKLSHKPEYKYDLDEILSTDPKQLYER